MKANIKLNLFDLTPLRAQALLRNVAEKLDGNANFPSPPTSAADLAAKADTLEAAILEAINGSQAARAARDARVMEVRGILRSVADYVRMVAQGDAAKLTTSGFELAKRPEPVGVPGTARDMRVRMTNSKGALELRWRTVHGARGYQVWMTASDPNVEANWEAIGYTTRASHLVTDLESYKAYWFCVSAIGAAGEGLQCDPAMGRAA
ncbi:MAG: fibronectin type III domain-containing protein [Flavobacteriales bacterium]|nr:fibronectin type III domain-containing protein [Flavobacteriales bacterium]